MNTIAQVFAEVVAKLAKARPVAKSDDQPRVPAGSPDGGQFAPKWFHGTRVSGLASIAPQPHTGNEHWRAIDRMGTWVTSHPDQARIYGEQVYGIDHRKTGIGRLREMKGDGLDELVNADRFEAIIGRRPKKGELEELLRPKSAAFGGKLEKKGLRAKYWDGIVKQMQGMGYGGLVWRNSSLDRLSKSPSQYDVILHFTPLATTDEPVAKSDSQPRVPAGSPVAKSDASLASILEPTRPTEYRMRHNNNNDATVAKALQEGEGLYIGRPVVNADQLRAYCVAHGLFPVPDPHATVIYSRTKATLPLDRPRIDVPTIAFGRIGPLGTKGAIVLTFQSPALEQRYAEAIAAGATSDYPAYIPHVTLAYVDPFVADERDYSAIPLPTFPIVLGPEAAGPTEANVFDGLYEGIDTRYQSGFSHAEVAPSVYKGDKGKGKAGCDCTDADTCDDPECETHGAAVRAKREAAVSKGAYPGLRYLLEQRTPHTIAALRTGKAQVSKVDGEQRLVSGWANVSADAEERPVVDRQKEVVPLAVIAKSARAFFAGDRTLGTMHLRTSPDDLSSPPLSTGEVIEGLIVTPLVKKILELPANTPLGLAITARVASDVVWQMVKDEKLLMFSIHGTAKKRRGIARNVSPTFPT